TRTRGELLEECAGLLHLLEAHDVAIEPQVVPPAPQHAPLALPRRHRQAMVATVRDPGEEALDREVAGLEDAGAEAETGDRAEVLVDVLDRVLAPQHGDEVLRETLGLTHGVLGIGHAEAAHPATG